MSATDFRKETISVHALQLGMFVSELDRPWLETPFLLQGFVLENEQELDYLQQFCSTVVIDRTLSIGDAYVPPPKVKVAVIRKREAIVIEEITARSKKSSAKPITGHSPKISFINLLRQLADSPHSDETFFDKPDSSAEPSAANRAVAEHPTTSPSFDHTPEINPDSVRERLKQSISEAFGMLRSWLPGINMFGKSTGGPSSAQKAAQQANSEDGDSGITDEASTPVEEEMAIIYPVFEQTRAATREIFEAVASAQHIDLIHVNQTLDSMVESIERNPDALMWLAKLKQRDNYAYNHALTVSIYLMALASFMALPRNVIKDLGLAGMLLDIGKVKIAPELLHKLEQLSPEELAIIKTHVIHSVELLRQTDNIPDHVLDIVANHHERINGNGYPLHLERDQISLPAQMAGLIDTYCAMTSTKVYAKGLFNQQTLEYIYSVRDEEFSSPLVDQLIQFFGIYPVSSLVELNTGEVAVVIQQNHVRRLQPRIMLLLDPDKNKNPHAATLDLIYAPLTPDGKPYSIVRGLPPDSYGLNPADFYLM